MTYVSFNSLALGTALALTLHFELKKKRGVFETVFKKQFSVF